MNKNDKNILKVEIRKTLVRDEWVKTMPTYNKAEIKVRKEKFILDKWLEKYPEYDYINYATIEELANRTEYIGNWMREQNSEYNSLITLPEWAANDLTTARVEKIKDDFKQVNSLNRKVADQKMALAKHFKDYSKQIDEKYESDLKDILDGNEEVFILTYPKSHLPLHYVISSIQYKAKDALLSEEEKAEKGDNYVSPNDYDTNILDSWKKDLWLRHKNKEDIRAYIKEMGVDFYIPSTSVESGHLTNISHLLAYASSTTKARGIR